MTPLYIGYFTIGTPYQSEVVECMKTLDAFKLPHEFVGVPNRGKWEHNCAHKPEVIRRMIQKHDGRPLVYIDVDARVRKRPSLFEFIPDAIDLGCHFRHGVELLSGTLYIGPTAGARRLVDAWAGLCERYPNEWDQLHLATVVKAGQYNVYRLPAEYCRVFDDPKMGAAVIEHGQASRRLAGSVKA